MSPDALADVNDVVGPDVERPTFRAHKGVVEVEDVALLAVVPPATDGRCSRVNVGERGLCRNVAASPRARRLGSHPCHRSIRDADADWCHCVLDRTNCGCARPPRRRLSPPHPHGRAHPDCSPDEIRNNHSGRVIRPCVRGHPHQARRTRLRSRKYRSRARLRESDRSPPSGRTDARESPLLSVCRRRGRTPPDPSCRCADRCRRIPDARRRAELLRALMRKSSVQ